MINELYEEEGVLGADAWIPSPSAGSALPGTGRHPSLANSPPGGSQLLRQHALVAGLSVPYCELSGGDPDMTVPAWWTAEASNFIIRGRFQSPSEGNPYMAYSRANFWRAEHMVTYR